MRLDTPPAKQRDVDAALADPARVARARADHERALRKLGTAVRVAVDNGATWAEIFGAVEAAARAGAVEESGAQLAAGMRAKVHAGDDTF